MEMFDIIRNKTTFTVLSLNCQSISSKFEEFKLFINDLMDHHCYVDVINLQETWLCDSSYYDDFKLPGYDLYMQPHICTPHGRLITYFKSSLKVTVLNEVYQKSDSWEGMFFSIDNLNKSIIIGNIYRPPRELLGSLTNFNEEFNRVIQHNIIKNKKVILSGDFNINILKIAEKPAYANFFDMLTANSLLPNITYPTRITRTSATLIDNIYSNSFGEVVNSGIISNKSLSDHQLIFSCFDSIINLKSQSIAPTIKKTVNYEALNIEIKNTKRDTTSKSFIIDQQKISDPKLIANHFNNFFINIGNSDTHTDNDGFNKYLGHEQSHNFKFDTITNNETIRIITNIKSKHSCGHDSISTALLKQIKTEVSPSITLIINQCLTTGIFPNKLKIAKVVPVFKKGDNELLNNYRPISVLPSISKIFETVIYNQLYDYLQHKQSIWISKKT